MKRERYRTTRDIVILAGTELHSPPTRSSRWTRDWDAPIALDNDHTGYFSLDPAEGIESGAVERIEP